MSKPLIDLRSDTVTQPTAEMRAAMAAAVVGDDVYGEDPSINRLERRAAEVFEKEAALFVPSGTMGNTIGIKVHTNHGEEVLCEAHSHVLDWELSMMAWFAGCVARSVPTSDGILHWEQIEPALRRPGKHNATTTLICLENTHNMAGGTVYPQPVIDEICGEAHALGLKVHMDGARVFNASVASGVSVARITRDVDSVMFCVSKGLSAPVGSLLVGTSEAIGRGRAFRKRLGGGMRQAGILAAAGLIALERMPQRLVDDHQNAALLADGLESVPKIVFDRSLVQTNIVIFDIAMLGLTTAEFTEALKQHGVLASEIGGTRMRLVTHRDVTSEQCKQAIGVIAEVAAQAVSAIA
jgi:threonine aldolase